MTKFSKTELEEAQRALSSSIRKIERAQETLMKKQPPPKAQLTLAARNLRALNIAIALIARELEGFDGQSTQQT
jgi:hypothetical protein